MIIFDGNGGPVSVSCAGKTSLTVFVMYLSPLKPKPCVLHNFVTLRHILIMFGRNEEGK